MIKSGILVYTITIKIQNYTYVSKVIHDDGIEPFLWNGMDTHCLLFFYFQKMVHNAFFLFLFVGCIGKILVVTH